MFFSGYTLFPYSIRTFLSLFYSDIYFLFLFGLLFTFLIWLFFHFLFGLLHPFHIWTFISTFNFDFSIPFLFGLLYLFYISFLFWLLYPFSNLDFSPFSFIFLFWTNRGHILDFFQVFFLEYYFGTRIEAFKEWNNPIEIKRKCYLLKPCFFKKQNSVTFILKLFWAEQWQSHTHLKKFW